ncbi:MAG: glycoside hydrolase, partial [Bacteroidia bacterium]|nr:glycoside hydrolase [Bacteroidia bacterium]
MKNIYSVSLFFFCISFSLLSQEPVIQELDNIHHEVEEDPYVYVDRNLMPKGPAYSARGDFWFTTQVNVDGNGDDIIGDAANEPSLAVDPTNNNRIVVGWRQFDNISSNFRQAGYGHSDNGGFSFVFPGPINPGVFRSDPVLDFDGEGNLYYNSLRGNFACDVYKIEDGSFTWEGPFPAFGGDKQWMRIDRTNGIGSRNNYSNWNESFTTCSPGYFTRSTDGSETFETCIEIDESPRWGTLAVDANGDLYVVGISNNGTGFVLIKSTTAKDPNEEFVTWDSVTVVDLDGDLGIGDPVNPQGLLGQVWVDVDLNNDNVYVLATVDRFSNGDPADVMFAKSTDGGVTFAPPVRLNTDPGTDARQWFGTMSVAPNGRIDVVWLDTRDATGNFESVLYYIYSGDEGESWSLNRPISESFDPGIGYPQQQKMGDYFDMKSDDQYAHLAWANTINGGQDVYYTRIVPNLLAVDDLAIQAFDAKISPNPFNESTWIEFSIHDE